LNAGRAEAGAYINRLEHTVSNLMNVIQRTEEARSRIEDADFATESASLARANVLTQAGSAMLAQANQAPMYVLTLLRG
jgi:flagellin